MPMKRKRPIPLLGDTPPISLAMRRPLGGDTQTVKRFGYSIMCLIAAIPVLLQAQEQYDWRQQAQEMLDEGRVSAVLYLLEDTANHINEIQDPIAQVNSLRYLGELYQQAGNTKFSAQYFRKALQRALEIEPQWKRLSAVTSVLELHRKAIPEHQGLAELLQMVQAADLLTAIAKDAKAKDVGRYIQCFDGVAMHSEIVGILRELRVVEREEIRKHALFALTKITSVPDARHTHEEAPNPPYDADAYERFLWQVVIARINRQPATKARYRESLEQAHQLVEHLPKERRRSALAMLRELRSIP